MSSKSPEEMSSFFDVRADSYEQQMQSLDLDEFYRVIAEPFARTTQAISILDLGCGTGLELEGILDKAPNALITGIDMSEKMLAALKKKYSHLKDRLTLIRGSYLDVPFGNEQYDAAVSVMSIHHFLHDTKRELYEKIKNSLKPGGIYVEGDYVVSDEEERKLLEEYHQKMKQLDANRLYHIDIPFSIGTQKQLLIQAGFREVQVLWHKDAAAVLVADT